ncbi:four-carbon acid sugar kinase family protein [Clostridium sediminicola]|uniref:four-carbon acid sugar kinase family protein n=1 Tax=Clostridium sediminicola TaxID=3114879 RepID=UPI0031F1F105
MNEKIIKKTVIEESLPNEWSEDLVQDIDELLNKSKHKLVVLDDDPTGTQTVHDLPILTEWSIDILTEEFKNDEYNAFYILTNSRAMSEENAIALNKEIAQNLKEAAKNTDSSFAIVSRGDSTLRGHFLKEVNALQEALQEKFDGWILFPYFLEGGRYTANDIHYVKEGVDFIPAGLTPFADDHTFGYKSSNLKEWIEEKTNGDVKKEDVVSITLDDIRKSGPDKVKEKLVKLFDSQICIVNAFTYKDVEVFVKALLEAEGSGKKFLYRTSSSFVKTRAGNTSRSLLSKEELNVNKKGGGLLIVGSYVPKTTEQVQTLIKETDIESIEIDVSLLINEETRENEIISIAEKVDAILEKEKDVAIYTSRRVLKGDETKSSLAKGNLISDGLIEILHSLESIPRYVIAKGGITSSDVATKGIGIKRAVVMGQILKGIPVWKVGKEGRYPDSTYIVFPGNVGDEYALADAVKILSK